jgi:hypothetical protein
LKISGFYSDNQQQMSALLGTDRDGVIKHLEVDHRRTETKALALMERSAEGTLGWDPETKKKKAAGGTLDIGD